MPNRWPPNEVWQEVRKQVWERDGGLCQDPFGKHPVALAEAHIDHVVSGKRGTNKLSELRTLCRFHHVLRADGRQRGPIAAAFREGVAGLVGKR